MSKPDTHVMIDLETAGSGPRAAILSIGAVEFDPLDPSWTAGAAFEAFITFDDAFRYGVADGDTFAWWLKQSEAARGKLLAPRRESLKSALYGLSRFYRSVAGARASNAVPVWGNGATFDITILEAAFAALDLSEPWRFSVVRDCRTIKDVAGKALTCRRRRRPV